MCTEAQMKIHPSILIVDDEPYNLNLLLQVLSGRGYIVHPAISGQIALNYMVSKTPDLILLDIRMPEMDGYEVCREIKTNSRLSHIPIIFISAMNETEDKIKGFEAGGVDFITKPFREAEVLVRVETHLTLSRLQWQLEQKNKLLFQEVEERKKAELALQEAYDKIEVQIQERTSELRRVNAELVEKEARTRGILNAVPDLLFVLNQNGVFVEYVAKEPEMLLVAQDFFLNKNVTEVLPDKLTELTMKMINKTLETGETQIFEYDLQVNDEQRYFETHMAEGIHGQVVCIIRDITVQKMEQETIRKVNADLEQKVSIRTAELTALNHKLDELSRIDPLTGLSNRRDLQEKFEIERSRTLQNEKTFAVIMGDIDHFKLINDTYGHECGDEVLKQLSVLMRSHVRLSDTVARYGGEEFVILLSDIDFSGAKEVAEKIRRVVELNDFVCGNQIIRITISLGVYTFWSAPWFTECIELVDHCLYEAKNSGRNKVVSMDNLKNGL